MAQLVPRYTVDDLDDFPRDGNRYELLDGVLLVTPAPGTPHQIVASRFMHDLTRGIGASGLAYVVGPGAVRRPPGTQLEPDVLVFPSRFRPSTPWRKITEFWLAIEVLSPTSRIYDRDFKRDAYLALGVREVWLVDWRERVVEVTRSPGRGRAHRGELWWRPPGLAKVRISLDAIFEDLEPDFENDA